MEGASGTGPNTLAVELWRLPSDFFALDAESQWEEIKRVTVPAQPRTVPREPCKLHLREEVAAVSCLAVILGLPVMVPLVTLVLACRGSPALRWWIGLVLFLAFHPIPSYKPWYRRNFVCMALAKYFTTTFLFNRDFPQTAGWVTPDVDEHPVPMPCICLACPHGVLNFGAIVWVFFSRWICGADQYTAGVSAVNYVPGLRYLAAALWVIPAERKTLKKHMQEPNVWHDKEGRPLKPDMPRRGGMIGVVPDGIAGIFKSKPGIDALYIGKKRGLMRICLEEGAIIMAGWFSGTSELFWILQDPFGVMEWISRKLRLSIFLFVGRWGLPIPRRVAITMCSRIICCPKVASPSDEAVEQLHNDVYAGLSRDFESLRHFAGYPTRQLRIM